MEKAKTNKNDTRVDTFISWVLYTIYRGGVGRGGRRADGCYTLVEIYTLATFPTVSDPNNREFKQNIRDLRIVKGIQRSAMKLILGYLSYKDGLVRLNLSPIANWQKIRI